MSTAHVIHADCLAALRDMPDASVDAVVTDPPYGLSNTTPAQVADTITRWVSGDREYLPTGRGFMGHEWDGFVPPVAVWDECLRVLKPGGHLLAFAGSRTHDLMTLGIRLAGFEIRDSVAWLYGSGFPKSMDVSKAIDKLNGRKFEDRYALGRHIRERREVAGLTRAEVNSWFGYKDGCEHWERQDPSGARVPTLADWRILKERLGLNDDHLALVERVEAERQIIGTRKVPKGHAFAGGTYGGNSAPRDHNDTTPTTDAARQWEGWGTALKPAFEPVTLARKPLTGTVAANVLEHGTGALNIDGCRIPGPAWTFKHGPKTGRGGGVMGKPMGREGVAESSPAGRWPANVVLDEWMEPVLRLRYNIPNQVEKTIREAFGASTSHLPAVQDNHHGPAEQGGAPEVLLTQVQGDVDVRESDGRECAALRQGAHAGVAQEDERDQEGAAPSGREESPLEGRHILHARLPDGEDRSPVARGRSASGADEVGELVTGGLHTRASTGGGSDDGKAADLGRACASHEREEGRQSAREPGSAFGLGAPEDARGGGQGSVATAEGERRAKGAPLEVLQRDCPPQWHQYFEVVGHRRDGMAAELDRQSGNVKSGGNSKRHKRTSPNWGGYSGGSGIVSGAEHPPSEGGASRYFYVAKAPKSERPVVDGTAHPTVKPVALMRWLVRMVTPPGGTVLDPFAGSGTTLEAAMLEGFNVTGIEREADYLPLIQARIDRATAEMEARAEAEGDTLFPIDGAAS